jgi:hypothetical protein
MEKDNLNSYKDFGTTCKFRLKTRLEYGLNRFLKSEDIELLGYTICTQSRLNDTGKLNFIENQIKNKVKKILDLPEFWDLDGWLIYWIDFFASFITIDLTYMKIRPSKSEKKFGEAQKKEAEKRKDIWNAICCKEREY